MVMQVQGISKSYRLEMRGGHILKNLLSQASAQRVRTVLAEISLSIGEGEVVGLIGVNGAGKSTFLKIVAGMLRPSTGTVTTEGRICALLELGAGFHPDMTGRENVFLAGAVAGRSHKETLALFDSIVDFAGLSSVIDQPVKTYSSGMIMRLAFSVATAVDPDILILDETLSVGDGAFARKSFERIMAFKAAGKTILFCSHSLYQVEAICSRVLWLDQGRLMMDGEPQAVVRAYNDHLLRIETGVGETSSARAAEDPSSVAVAAGARILRIKVSVEGQRGTRLSLCSEKSDLLIDVDFVADLQHPPPSLGVMIQGSNGRPVTSALSLRDGYSLERDARGMGEVRVVFPKLPLLRGNYWVNVFLLCDQGLHVYENAYRVAELEVDQEGPELGIVSVPRRWGMAEPFR